MGIGGASSTLAFFCLETVNLESCNKLYLDFRCSDVDVDFSYQLMHCLTCFMSSMLLLYFIPCAVRHSTGSLISSFPSFLSSDNRLVLVGHVYSALSEEMQAGAGRAVTLGIRALGCVVNLGKLSGRDNIRIRESVFVITLVFKSYIYILLVV